MAFSDGYDTNTDSIRSRFGIPAKIAITTIIVSTIITVLVIVGVVLLTLGTVGKERIADIRRITATYGLIESRANYLVLLKKVKLIEKGLHQTKAICGKRISDKKRITTKEKEDYSACVYLGKVIYGLDEDLMLSITSAESEWNKKAYSHRGAKGLWQLLKRTFNWVNQVKLDKFKTYNMYSIYHNSEAAVRYMSFSYNTMEHILNRKPTPEEQAWAYHAGTDGAIDAIVSGDPENTLSSDTLEHGKKVLFYYRNYKDGNYSVWWYEKFLRGDKDNAKQKRQTKGDNKRS